MCLDVSLFQDLPHLLVLSYILVPPAAGDPQHPWVLCHEPPSLGVAQPVSVVSAVCLTWDVEDQGAASLGDLLDKTVCVLQTAFLLLPNVLG